MLAVVQRVKSASVDIGGETVGSVGHGFMVLLGVEKGDGADEARFLAEKIVNLRVFEDPDGKMNLSIVQVGGGILAVPNFTLAADMRKGNRPSFINAEHPDLSSPLFDGFCELIEDRGVSCARGIFGAEMAVSLVNDGPVTLVMDTGVLMKK